MSTDHLPVLPPDGDLQTMTPADCRALLRAYGQRCYEAGTREGVPLRIVMQHAWVADLEAGGMSPEDARGRVERTCESLAAAIPKG